LSESIASLATYSDVVSVRTVIGLDEAEAPVVRSISDTWKKVARGRPYPRWADFDTSAFGKALNNLLVLRVIGDCDDYEFRIVGTAHIRALGLVSAHEKLSHLDAIVPGLAATLKPLYDRAVRSRKPYALRSELRKSEEATPFFCSESAFLPLGPSAATVDHVMVVSLYRKLPGAAASAGAARTQATANATGSDQDKHALGDALRKAAKAIARRMTKADEIDDPFDRVLALLKARMPLDAERTATWRLYHRLAGEGPVDDAVHAELAHSYEAWRAAVREAVIDAQEQDHFAVHDARALAESLVGLAEGLGIQAMFDPKRMPPARLRKRLADTVEHLAEGSPFGPPAKKPR
jgi:hypothetical protein